MANVSNYTFDNMARIGLDPCCIDQTTIQNMGYANYMLQNYFVSDCTMKKPIDLATSQPGIFYNGGNSIAAGGLVYFSNASIAPSLCSSIHPFLQIILVLNV